MFQLNSSPILPLKLPDQFLSCATLAKNSKKSSDIPFNNIIRDYQARSKQSNKQKTKKEINKREIKQRMRGGGGVNIACDTGGEKKFYLNLLFCNAVLPCIKMYKSLTMSPLL
jgi:hypothetical protein